MTKRRRKGRRRSRRGKQRERERSEPRRPLLRTRFSERSEGLGPGEWAEPAAPRSVRPRHPRPRGALRQAVGEALIAPAASGLVRLKQQRFYELQTPTLI